MFKRSVFLAITFVCGSTPAFSAINCPEMPSSVTSVNRDVKTDINASIGSLGKIKAGEVGIKTEVVAKNLFEKYPNVDRLLTIQTMSSTYCSMLNSAKISDEDRLNRWEAFQGQTLNFQQTKPQSTPVRTSNDQKSRVTDILIEKIDGKSAIIDFRVLNEGRVDLQISRVILEPIKHERVCASAPADYSKVYDFTNIGGLDPMYNKPQEITVSQIIEAGKSDRFGIKVGETHPSCFNSYWKIRAYLVTSIGKIGGKEIEIDLRR